MYSDDESDSSFHYDLEKVYFLDDRDSIVQLQSMREKVNWDIADDRIEFLHLFNYLINHWKGQLPDLRDFWQKEEIDGLLVKKMQEHEHVLPVMEFLIKTGYVDEPNVDENGKPLLLRTTPVHYAASSKNRVNYNEIRQLFKIYNRFDVNYTDELGCTHFHVACATDCHDVVEKFLELGQDPNCLEYVTGNSPLHLAIEQKNVYVVEVLLRNGADPNLANADGSTPLHIICNVKFNGHNENTDMAEKLFELGNDRSRPLKVDAVDKLGRTPLQLAVANFLSNTVDLLLDHGADLSRFVFPTVSHCNEESKPSEDYYYRYSKSILPARALIVIECLEKKGYELKRSDALTIMTFFAECGFFNKSVDLERFWYDDEELAAQDLTIVHDLSIYDLIQLRPEEAAKLFTYEDFFLFVNYYNDAMMKGMPRRSTRFCVDHLNEIMSRKFFRRWALDSFLELTRYQLPVLCCDLILEKLRNKHLWHICLAATAQSS